MLKHKINIYFNWKTCIFFSQNTFEEAEILESGLAVIPVSSMPTTCILLYESSRSCSLAQTTFMAFTNYEGDEDDNDFFFADSRDCSIEIFCFCYFYSFSSFCWIKKKKLTLNKFNNKKLQRKQSIFTRNSPSAVICSCRMRKELYSNNEWSEWMQHYWLGTSYRCLAH